MNRTDHPQSGLAALLDALEGELLAADASDVGAALGETGRDWNMACREIHTLLNEAIAAGEGGFPVIPALDLCARYGPYRH
jgi:hypothetical protein